MKVYRLVECSGTYEDYTEMHVGTYLDKERAKNAKKENEEINKQAEEQAILCDQCYDTGKCQQLCLSFKASSVNKSECVNWSTHWGPCIYRIDEEEVIE